MGSKTRLNNFCTKRRENPAILVTLRNINTRLARPISFGYDMTLVVHWYFQQFRCYMRKISAKRYRGAKSDTDMVVVSRKLGRKYRTNRVLNPGPVVCESITLSARP